MVAQLSDAGTAGARRRQRVAGNTALYANVVDFLYDEASALDHDELTLWLDLLTTDIEYRMPTRVTVNRVDGDGFVGGMSHLDEDRLSLELRVKRLTDLTTAWAEDPPSRARRYVSNVRVWRGESDTELAVCSYVLLTRSRWDSADLELVTAERSDILRITDDGMRIARREIWADQTSLGTLNMALFL